MSKYLSGCAVTVTIGQTSFVGRIQSADVDVGWRDEISGMQMCIKHIEIELNARAPARTPGIPEAPSAPVGRVEATPSSVAQKPPSHGESPAPDLRLPRIGPCELAAFMGQSAVRRALEELHH